MASNGIDILTLSENGFIFILEANTTGIRFSP